MSSPVHRPGLPQAPRLPPAVPRSGLSDEARLALRQLLDDHARALAQSFVAGADARLLATARAELVRRVVVYVWTLHLGEATGLALFAQGGFGRGRLYPQSDVDLLVLTDAAAAPVSRGFERVFAVLWDLGLKPSQAVRTLAGQRALASHDLSVFTAMLETSWLAGDASLAGAPAVLARDETLWPLPAFLDARMAEQAVRRARRGEDTYRLEPDLKDGPGGLRQIDMLYWIGLRMGAPPTWDGLVQFGLIDTGAAQELEAAESLLARDRYALHLHAGRAEERLLFDHQRALALRLGYVDTSEALAVEHFMQGYYRAATSVMARVDEAVARLVARLQPVSPPIPLDNDWQRRGPALEPRDATLLARYPAALIEGACWIDAGAGIHHFSAETLRAARASLNAVVIDDAFARDPRALEAFDRLLHRGAEAPAALTLLARAGALGALIPAFATVSGRMQFDLFHLYTVDEHTLRVLAQLALFATPTATERFPLAHALWKRQTSLPVLLLAALFHDIAKGRGGDHSALGEADVRGFAGQLGWPQPKIDDAAFLVRDHLLLSQTAQRQDIGDPLVIGRFATRVGSSSRLEMLYLLTVADIIGTSPSLWNGFKDRLLADLYHAASRALSGEAGPDDAEAIERECRARAMALLQERGRRVSDVHSLWQDFPAAAFVRQQPEQVAWQSEALLDAAGALPVVAAQADSARGGLEVFFLAADRDGLFATVAVALDREGWSVQEARILGTPSGRALDSFVLLDSHGGAGTADQAARLCERLAEALRAPQRPRLPRSLPRRLRHFQRAPRIAFESSGHPSRTRLAIRASDRPGLLVDIAEAFRESGVRVHDARIATLGDRAEDYFELSDRNDHALDATRQSALRAQLDRRLGSPANVERKP